MPITHAFVNGKADGADTTVTRPSDWNASHTITGPLPFHGCRVSDTSGQSVANNSLAAMALAGTELYDSDAYHDTVTNNSRITIPAGLGGTYRFGGQVALSTTSTTGERLIGIRLNGATFIALDHKPAFNITATEQYFAISTEYVMAVTDYVELMFRQVSGGPLNLSVNTTYGCQFYASLIGV